MVHADEVIENPATGERVVFRRTAAETRGELLEYEFVFRPRGFVAAEHVHPRQAIRPTPHQQESGRFRQPKIEDREHHYGGGGAEQKDGRPVIMMKQPGRREAA